MEAVEAPQSFQVSFSDISTGKVGLEFTATAGFGAATFTDESAAPTGDVAVPDDSFAPAADTGGAFTVDDSASFDTGSSSFTSTPPAPRPSAPAVGAAPVAPRAATPTAVRRPGAVGGNLLGALPIPALVFLLLFVLGGAVFLGFVLGPLAAPTVAATRSGGVSRALEARAGRSPR